MPEVVALNHVGVSVADLERARAFWIDELGALDHGRVRLAGRHRARRRVAGHRGHRRPGSAAAHRRRLPRAVRVRVAGLVGVTVRVPDPVDLGVNHLCLDVAGIADVRAGMQDVRWHHDVTESSGGIAAVCYGTTADGVLVELLESRSEDAFLSRCRLAYE